MIATKSRFFVDFLWSDFFISEKQGKFRATTKNIKDMMNNNSTTNSEKKPIIDNDEALRLIDLIQQGDSNAENELAELGSVFIKAVAKQYVGKGLSDEALIAASRYGMIRASHKFDKSRGFKFASYAVWWMREAILQEIRKKGNNLKRRISISQMSRTELARVMPW